MDKSGLCKSVVVLSNQRINTC